MSEISTPLEREEYVEQAYFFRVMRERVMENVATQEILEGVHQEILSTTRLPLAIEFLATDIRHTGLLSSGFHRLAHYFTPFQAYVIEMTEAETHRFNVHLALLVLEREAQYKSKNPTHPGLFVYQFEVLCRNRLGYDEGLKRMSQDPFYPKDWKEYIIWIRAQMGVTEIADLMYLRSDLYVRETRRTRPDYEPSLPPLFQEKEGKIAKANYGRDPLYFFSALQRQLDYPEVPRPTPVDNIEAKMEEMRAKIRNLEQRLKLLESEMRGQIDLSQFAKPEAFKDEDED